MMLQDTQKHREEIEYLTEACKHYEQLFGPLSLQIAPMYSPNFSQIIYIDITLLPSPTVN